MDASGFVLEKDFVPLRPNASHKSIDPNQIPCIDKGIQLLRKTPSNIKKLMLLAPNKVGKL